MGDNAGLSKLVELIFGKKATIPEKKEAQSYVPSSLLTEDFSKKFADVLFIRKMIVLHYSKENFERGICEILSSHKNYMAQIMMACICELECNRNRFDSFISVCALVIKWNEDIRKLTGVNFSDLNPDIFMVFYRYVLKKSFRMHKDFYKLVEYIRGHKYLTWNRNDVILGDDPTAPVLNYSDEKIKEEFREYRITTIIPNDRKYLYVFSLAEEVLLNTTVVFPTLPNKPDLIMKLVAYRKKELAIKAEKQRKLDSALTIKAFNGDSSLNSDAENHNVAKELDDIARHENIIQAVIRHNHSKKSNRKNATKKLPEEFDGILKHLKNGIKSLAEVLDECNKGVI